MEKNEKIEMSWLDKPVFKAFPKFSWEQFIVTILIIAAALSRFIMLGNRVMSHDEVNHVVPSYNFYKGSGYIHDPITHGPFQFHMVALSYFIFGDSDFASRVPAALFSLAALIFVLVGYRRYLGRIGALCGGLLFLFSPFILFYSRYTRNEAFIMLFAVLTLYGMLRYFEKRDSFSLYLLAVVTSLQFCTKETAYIYTAQLLFFCGCIFLRDLWNMNWPLEKQKTNFLTIFLAAGIVLLGGLGLLIVSTSNGVALTNSDKILHTSGLVLCSLAILILIGDVVSAVIRLSWKPFREMPSFNLIIFIGALILPQLSAFVIKMIGWNPLDYSQSGMIHSGIILLGMFAISFLIGCWWNKKVFLRSAAAFYIIFVTFYTTIFSNGQGFFTGIIGSLGYWLSQQSVQRGGQPAYYYALILLPIYEFAAIAGSILALVYGIRHNKFWQKPGKILSAPETEGEEAGSESLSEIAEADGAISPQKMDMAAETEEIQSEGDASVSEPEDRMENPAAEGMCAPEGEVSADSVQAVLTDAGMDVQKASADKANEGKAPVLLLFLYWTVTSIIAYSIAGEKMPWLAVHIAMPLALCAAWGLGYLLETMPWKKVCTWKSLAGFVSLLIAVMAFYKIFSNLANGKVPFAGKELAQLQITNQFVLTVIILALSIFALNRFWNDWDGKCILRTVVLSLMAFLIVLQGRAAFRASFVNYNYATEFLVYAHAGPAPKIVLNEIEDIAAKTGEGKSFKVAYDNDALYPYWWYFRDYTSKNYFGDGNPTRELRNYDAIIANTTKEGKLEPIVQDGYYKYEYVRLWWPNQDYWNLTPERIWNAFTNPQMRSALFDIWLNRDYTKYAQATGKSTFTPETWEPSARMVVYLKKDLLKKMYQMGDTSILSDNSQTSFSDDDKFVQINPDLSIGSEGGGTGQFEGPRNVAVSKDGTIYVLDTGNNRVEYFSADGTYQGMWDAHEENGFNQPWGIDVAPDGYVFVADTWNHRIMKFDAQGKFVLSWYSTDNNPTEVSFYGPRDVAVDSTGKVYISDTGNKRIMIYDENGNYLAKFGSAGMGNGKFDEEVGIALLDDSRLAVADTWNQRVQIIDVSSPSFPMISSFNVAAWYTQSLDNKPYIAASKEGNIILTDPESSLVEEYTVDGALVRSWNGAGGSIDIPSMPTGLSVDSDGAVWVADASNHRVNKFKLENLPKAGNDGSEVSLKNNSAADNSGSDGSVLLDSASENQNSGESQNQN